ncbi:uncharacterized protein LOC125812448 [Solanum verrucosum]|uniref:uncharacterized protein LOC125812448 n=1 Tax=Solanum verrucosum TaxID=315347 RepID=UPI0020D0541E|nr:uncharacterized protein LOC125812448 [Solanum verrucosum]
MSFSHSLSLRWTTILVTTREQQVTWWDMETITQDKYTTELPPLSRLRLILVLLAAGEAMLPGIVERRAILISLLVLLLVDLMPMTTSLIKETTMSKLSLPLTTMLR